MKVRTSNGPKAIYVEHGVWREGTRIHVTIPGTAEHHTSYGPGDRLYAAYDAILQSLGR
jgi:hypothetical protein